MEEILQNSPLFQAIDLSASLELRNSMGNIQFVKGQVIFYEGDTGDSLYVILKGKIKIEARSKDGRKNLLAILGPGDMFGELSLLDPGPRAATAVALTDIHLLSLTNAQFSKWLSKRPEVILVLLQSIVRRLRQTNDNLKDLVFSDVPGRIAKIIIKLGKQFGLRTSSDLVINHDLTQEEIAQLVGASRETVNKALSDFVQRGWIIVESRVIRVLNIDKIQNRARS
jgi:CRP-like cAMP-binding protein